MSAAGSLTLALHAARSGLLATQQALDATANNISNANTVGYSRKVVNMEQRVVNGVGAGVQVGSVTRIIDEGLLKSLRIQLSDYNRLAVQEDYYGRVQEMFGSPGSNTSISHTIDELASALESLAVTPNSNLEQSEVVRRASLLTSKLQTMSSTIQELRLQADSEIASATAEINDIITRLGVLNDKVIRNTIVTNDVSDLQDQRDQMLTRLSELIDIRYFYRGAGDVVVFTEGGRTLVDNQPPPISHSQASYSAASTTHAEGDFDGIYVGNDIAGNDITTEIRSGALKGLIDLRDNILSDLQSQIDELAGTLRDTVNQIHNSGVPFPGMQTMTGSRVFLDTSDVANAGNAQQIKISSDVRILIFDSSGDQAASVSLSALMTDPHFGGHTNYDGGTGYVAGEYWDVADVANVIQRWLTDTPLNPPAVAVPSAGLGLTGAQVGIDSLGHFTLDINNTNYSIAFRDETALGSAQADTTVSFDKDGDGLTDETVAGFSNFFGLNDFFVDEITRNLHESNVVAGSFTASATVLKFVDGSAAMPLPGGATVTIAAGDSLQTIAAKINAAVPGLTASVVPDGSGYRLRIGHNAAQEFEITETGNLLGAMGMHVSNSRASSTLLVRSDIRAAPGNISTGVPQWDSTIGLNGAYRMSVSDETAISRLATQFSEVTSFDLAGGLPTVDLTFSEYAATLLARNSSLASANATQTGYQKDLTDALQYKSDTFRGVNMDEEMSNLILLQQSYAAAARVITTINDMFDTLTAAMR